MSLILTFAGLFVHSESQSTDLYHGSSSTGRQATCFITAKRKVCLGVKACGFVATPFSGTTIRDMASPLKITATRTIPKA